MFPRRPPPPPDLPTRQIRAMREAFPQFRHEPDGAGLIWRGTLQPTAESPEYTVVITHPFDRVPWVRIVAPKLHQRAPHRYGDGTLCLYWPEEWRWTSTASLAATLVPWTALWLYYYEIWLVTDDWLGPSSPHGPGPERKAA